MHMVYYRALNELALSNSFKDKLRSSPNAYGVL